MDPHNLWVFSKTGIRIGAVMMVDTGICHTISIHSLNYKSSGMHQDLPGVVLKSTLSDLEDTFAGFYPNTFVYSRFPPKIQFLQTPKGECLKFKSADCQKMHFSWIFREFQSLYIHKSFLYACLQVSKPKSKKNRRIEWKIFQGCFKNKKERIELKTHEEIKFHNSVQD